MHLSFLCKVPGSRTLFPKSSLLFYSQILLQFPYYSVMSIDCSHSSVCAALGLVMERRLWKVCLPTRMCLFPPLIAAASAASLGDFGSWDQMVLMICASDLYGGSGSPFLLSSIASINMLHSVSENPIIWIAHGWWGVSLSSKVQWSQWVWPLQQVCWLHAQ